MEFTTNGFLRYGFGFYNPNHAAALRRTEAASSGSPWTGWSLSAGFRRSARLVPASSFSSADAAGPAKRRWPRLGSTALRTARASFCFRRRFRQGSTGGPRPAREMRSPRRLPKSRAVAACRVQKSFSTDILPADSVLRFSPREICGDTPRALGR